MKSKIIIAAAGVIALSIWADVISTTTHENRLNVPVEYSSKLIVNKRNSKRYITHKDEKEGVKDIEHWVNTSQYEEAWAYLPDKKEWVEVGLDEHIKIQESSKPFFSYLSIDTFFDMIGLNTYLEPAKETSTDLMLDTKKIESLMKENNNLRLYHFHPKDEICLYPAAHAMPSPQDLITMVGQTNKYRRFSNKGSITFKVCSPYGLAEYRLTEKGEKHFQNKNISYIKDWSETAFRTLTRELAIGFEAAVKNKTLSGKEASTERLVVRFEPYGLK